MTVAPIPPRRGATQTPWAWRPRHPWRLLSALVALFRSRDLRVVSTQIQRVPSSEFLQQLEADRLVSTVIGSQFIEARLKSAQTDVRTRLITTRVAPDLARELAAYDVRFEARVGNTLLRDLLP